MNVLKGFNWSEAPEPSYKSVKQPAIVAVDTHDSKTMGLLTRRSKL
jgi:hypothetical protein